jgi:hypothetical protein
MDTPEVIIHASDYAIERESIDSWIESNLSGKLDSYIKKHEKPNSPVRVELTLKRESNGKSTGKLVLTVGTKTYRSDREQFDSVSDLVNHLFTHVKDQMAK